MLLKKQNFKIIYLLLLSLAWVSCKKENQKPINKTAQIVQKQIAISQNESNSIKIRKTAADSALYYLSKDNTKQNRIFLAEISTQYYKLYKTKEYGKTAYKLLEYSTETNDSVSLSKAYNLLGKYKLDKKIYDSSYYYFKKAEKIMLKQNDSLGLTNNYLNTSLLNSEIGDYFNSEKAAIKTLIYNKSINNQRTIFDAYNLIAIASGENQNYGNALLYHKKAVYLIENKLLQDSDENLPRIYNNVGVLYNDMKKYNESIKYFKKALNKTGLKKNNSLFYSKLIDNYAYTKFKLKDFTELPDLFYKAIKIKERNFSHGGIAISKCHLSEYYFYFKDTIKAQELAQEAFKSAKLHNTPEYILFSLKQLITVSPNNSDYFKQYVQISDSLHLAERKTRDRFSRIAFETNEIVQQKNVAVKQKQKTLLISGLVFLLLLAGGIIKWLQVKQKQLKLIQAQQSANEEVYQLILHQNEQQERTKQTEQKRIAQELHDGILNKLAGIRLNLFPLSKKTDSQTIQNALPHINKIQDVEIEIRNLAHNLNPNDIETKGGFELLLKNYVEEQIKLFQIDIVLEIDSEIVWEKMTAVIKVTLFRIMQEALQNSQKHATANKISIGFLKDQNNICLSITDNGLGFDSKETQKGIGLKNMKDRVETLNGKITIISEINSGTYINLSIPTK